MQLHQMQIFRIRPFKGEKLSQDFDFLCFQSPLTRTELTWHVDGFLFEIIFLILLIEQGDAGIVSVEGVRAVRRVDVWRTVQQPAKKSLVEHRRL